jgi:hypothetical protein
VTICRPRCGKFSKEGEVGHDIPNEQVVSVPVKGKSVEQWTTGKEGPEYQALQVCFVRCVEITFFSGDLGARQRKLRICLIKRQTF